MNEFTDLILSPAAAKFISGFFAGVVVSIYALRFGLPAKTRIAIRERVRAASGAVRHAVHWHGHA